MIWSKNKTKQQKIKQLVGFFSPHRVQVVSGLIRDEQVGWRAIARRRTAEQQHHCLPSCVNGALSRTKACSLLGKRKSGSSPCVQLPAKCYHDCLVPSDDSNEVGAQYTSRPWVWEITMWFRISLWAPLDTFFWLNLASVLGLKLPVWCFLFQAQLSLARGSIKL